MALDPQLLEILACPEDKGPLLYFEDEDALYNPRLKRRYAIQDDIPIMLIDEAETVDDAEHERLLAKAEAQGIAPDVRGVGAMSGLLDSVGMFDLAAALPEQVAAAATLGAEVDGLPDHDADRERRRARHGRQRRRRRRRSPAVAGPFMPVPVTVVKGYEAPRSSARARCASPSPTRATPRRPSRRRRPRPSAGARMVVLSTGGELGRARRGLGRAAHRAARHPDAARRDRRGEHPAAPRARAGRAVPGRQRSTSPTRSTSCARRRDKLIVDGGPAQQLAARDRPHHADRLRRRRDRRGGGLPVQVPGQRERQGAGVLRRAVPGDGHNEICGWGQHGDVTRQVMTVVRFRHDFEHPQVARRFDLTYDVLDEVVHAVLDVEAAGEGALAQLFDLVHPGRLREPPHGRRGRASTPAPSRSWSTSRQRWPADPRRIT